LWDRSGPADLDIVRLEHVLSRLRSPEDRAFGSGRAAPAVFGVLRPSVSSLVALASLAAAVIALVGWSWFATVELPGGLAVTTLDGTPTIASRPVTDGATLRAGAWLETDDRARANIDIANIGRVEVEPGSRLGLVSTRPGQHRLQLVRGTIGALIWAPPGQFVVDTPSSTAVDLGCAYTLTVDDEGVGHVRVTTGWVGFEWRGRESFIPAGAVCLTRRGFGPGTPYFDDATPAFKASLGELDLQLGTLATRNAALDRVIADARARDTVSLWHLLSRLDRDQSARVFDRLAAFVPTPAGVTREGVLAKDRRMLDDWWDALGLGAANWWRVWKQQWRDAAGR
jgi:hypothetical protein